MLRSWDFKLQLNKASGLALYLQIAQQIIDDIQQGRLPPATVMPGTRELAENLRVNRKTVVLTYDELIAQGWLVTEHRRGTFVSDRLPHFPPTLNETNPPPAIANDRSALLSSNHPLGESVIDFSEGMPDTRFIPYEALSRAFRHSLVLASRSSLSKYENPKGSLELRTSIAAMLNMEKGLHVGAEHICVVRGSQMGIFIAARILTRPGDNIAFEHPTYASAREAFKSCGANILHIGIDEYGIKVDEIEKICRKHPLRAVFVTPQHQFPTTVTLRQERRQELLRLAERHDFFIVEDDHDHEFQFSDQPVFPLASGDRCDRVIYIGSLSKILAPGLRVGYLAASPAFADQCASEIILIDRQGNTAIELAISELMKSGEIKRHTRRMSKIYYDRRVTFQDLLRNELGTWVDFDLPKSGLAFWLRFKLNVDMPRLLKYAAKENLFFSSNSIFAEHANDIQGIRLGFANLNNKELADGMQRIKRVLMTCFAAFLFFACNVIAIQGEETNPAELFSKANVCLVAHSWA